MAKFRRIWSRWTRCRNEVIEKEESESFAKIEKCERSDEKYTLKGAVGGGRLDSVIAFNSNDQSSNHAEVNNFV